MASETEDGGKYPVRAGYRYLEHVGRGTFSKVYRAELFDRAGESVAIKEFVSQSLYFFFVYLLALAVPHPLCLSLQDRRDLQHTACHERSSVPPYDRRSPECCET